MMYWWINARNCILKTFKELCNFFMNNSRSWTLGLWQQSKDGRLPPMVSIWFVLSSQFTLIWYDTFDSKMFDFKIKGGQHVTV